MKIKELNSPPKFLVYALFRAVAHPKTPVAYRYCSTCKLDFNIKETECPRCHDKVGHSPEDKQESPIPWYGSVIVILIGVGVCIAGAVWSLAALERLGDYLVAIPLGSLFGMSLRR